MGSLLARNATVLVTMDGQRRELKNAGLYAEDGIIKQVGPTEELPATADMVIDLSGQIVLPGFVNTHHHLNQTLTRNFPGGAEQQPLPLAEGALPRLGRAPTPEASRASTLVGLAELALSGCTTVFDHTYVFKNGNTVDCQIEAARELGVRFHASRGSMSLGESKGGLPPDDCVEDEDFILKDSQRVIERYHDAKPGSMTQIVLAPCSPFSVTADAAEGIGRAGPALQGEAPHPSLRDAGRGALHAGALRAPPGRLDGDAGLAGRRRLVRPRHPCRRRRDPASSPRPAAARPTAPAPTCGSAPASRRSRNTWRAGVKVGLGVDGSASNDASNILLEARQAMLLARLRLGLLPPEGPRKHMFLSPSHPVRAQRMDDRPRAQALATSGGASRRKCEDRARREKVEVNKKRWSPGFGHEGRPGHRGDPRERQAAAARRRTCTWFSNKPEGVVSTMSNPKDHRTLRRPGGGPAGAAVPRRPARHRHGRVDRAHEGRRLRLRAHPSYEVDKTYVAEGRGGEVTKATLRKLTDGVKPTTAR